MTVLRHQKATDKYHIYRSKLFIKKRNSCFLNARAVYQIISLVFKKNRNLNNFCSLLTGTRLVNVTEFFEPFTAIFASNLDYGTSATVKQTFSLAVMSSLRAGLATLTPGSPSSPVTVNCFEEENNEIKIL